MSLWQDVNILANDSLIDPRGMSGFLLMCDVTFCNVIKGYERIWGRFSFITLPVFVDVFSYMILFYLVDKLTALILLFFLLAALTVKRRQNKSSLEILPALS